MWEGQLALSRPAEQEAPLHSPAARRRALKGTMVQFLYINWHPGSVHSERRVDGNLNSWRLLSHNAHDVRGRKKKLGYKRNSHL